MLSGSPQKKLFSGAVPGVGSVSVASDGDGGVFRGSSPYMYNVGDELREAR